MCRHRRDEHIFAGSGLPTKDRSSRSEPCKNLVHYSRIDSACGSAVLLVQIQDKQIVLDRIFAEFTSLDRHKDKSLVAASVLKFMPCVLCGLIRGVVSYGKPDVVEIFPVSYIHDNGIVNMGSDSSHDRTFRVSLHVSQDITVDKISDIDLRSFPIAVHL